MIPLFRHVNNHRWGRQRAVGAFQLPAQSSCGTLLCACALMALNIPVGIGPKLEDPGWGLLGPEYLHMKATST